MSQDTEKYLYFKVGLLKDSFALEALWQDALRYHMLDQPAKLIAMRLTEYYELTGKGSGHTATSVSTSKTSTASTPVSTELRDKEDAETPTSSNPAIRPPAAHLPARPLAARPLATAKAISTTADQADALDTSSDISSLAVSSEVDQNAEEAADYWSLL